MDKNYDAIAFILRRPRVAVLADIIKIVCMIFKTIFKVSKKVKRITNYLSKCKLYLVFFDIEKFAYFW